MLGLDIYIASIVDRKFNPPDPPPTHNPCSPWPINPTILHSGYSQLHSQRKLPTVIPLLPRQTTPPITPPPPT